MSTLLPNYFRSFWDIYISIIIDFMFIIVDFVKRCANYMWYLLIFILNYECILIRLSAQDTFLIANNVQIETDTVLYSTIKSFLLITCDDYIVNEQSIIPILWFLFFFFLYLYLHDRFLRHFYLWIVYASSSNLHEFVLFHNRKNYYRVTVNTRSWISGNDKERERIDSIKCQKELNQK